MTLQTDAATGTLLATTLVKALDDAHEARRVIREAQPQLDEAERLKRLVGQAKHRLYFAEERAQKARAALVRMCDDPAVHELARAAASEAVDHADALERSLADEP